jgi:exopolysaccharide/PEP-CTERM locus tyrosine autokinase
MGKMFDALQKVERDKYAEPEEEVQKSSIDDIVLDDKLVSYFQPTSIATEQFRGLRTYIMKLRQDDRSPRTILVTSAMAGEGKSLIAVNLATVIATELHSHALLVDCDLRNPSLSRLFGVEEKIGLSDYLTGDFEIKDLLVKTPIDKLSFISGGGLKENPVELIGSNKMKFLINELKSRYKDRYIIFDSSPVMATTEPVILNKMIDGIIIVIKSGETTRESIARAIKILDKGKILGVVLNSLEFKTNAIIRRNFGTHSNQYDEHYPDPGLLEKFSSLSGLLLKKFKF